MVMPQLTVCFTEESRGDENQQTEARRLPTRPSTPLPRRLQIYITRQTLALSSKKGTCPHRGSSQHRVFVSAAGRLVKSRRGLMAVNGTRLARLEATVDAPLTTLQGGGSSASVWIGARLCSHVYIQAYRSLPRWLSRLCDVQTHLRS